MSGSARVHNAHFGHQPFVRHVGPAPRNFRVVKRKIGKSLLAVPPGQLANLGSADAAIAIEDHHVGAGSLVGSWQLGCRHSGNRQSGDLNRARQ